MSEETPHRIKRFSINLEIDENSSTYYIYGLNYHQNNSAGKVKDTQEIQLMNGKMILVDFDCVGEVIGVEFL